MNRDIKNIPSLSDIRLLDIDTGAEWRKFQSRAGISKTKTYKLGNWLKVAASVVIIAGAGLLAGRISLSPKAENFIASEAIMETTVETSTKISLNRHSEITCTDARSDGKYSVDLKGEAYFDVEKNAERTFEINTKDVTVTVHGTSFDVCETAEGTVVTVTSGNVGVKARRSEQSVSDLTRGKQLICGNDGSMEVRDVENFNCIAWKLRKLEFNNQSMDEIMDNLGSMYGFSYEFADSGIAARTITGTFDNQNLETVFSILEETLDIKFEKQPGNKWVVR